LGEKEEGVRRVEIKELERRTAEIMLRTAIIGLTGSILQALLIFFTYNRNMLIIALVFSIFLMIIVVVIVSSVQTKGFSSFNWPWIQSELYWRMSALMLDPENVLHKINYTGIWFLAYTTALLDGRESYAKGLMEFAHPSKILEWAEKFKNCHNL